MRKALILTALMVVAIPAHADERLSRAAATLEETGEIHLGLFNNGERDGFMRLGWQRVDNILRVYDRSMMPSVEVYEAYAGEMDTETLFPRSVDIQFYQGTAILEISMTMEGPNASGTRKVTRPGTGVENKPVAVELPEGTLLRAVTFILPLVLDATPGDTFSYPWFASMSQTVNNVTLSVKDGGTVETPAGQFETVVYELRGGAPENDIYVSKGAHPQIVRIDVVGQSLQFLMVEKQ